MRAPAFIKNHQYALNTSPECGRRRLSPGDRKAFLFNAYIGMCAGDITIPVTSHKNKIGFMYDIGHTAIAEVSNVSVATVFNYFNTTEDLHNSLETWAKCHYDSEDQKTAEAAHTILLQFAAAKPKKAQESGFTLQLTTPAMT